MSRGTLMLPTRNFRLLLGGLALAFSASCDSATTSVSPTPTPKCQVAVAGGQLAIAASGGTGAVSVSATPECAWTVSAAASWISGLTPASGQGNGEIKFQVAPNPASTSRQSDISLNGATATVTQAGAPCGIDITPRRQTMPMNGGTGTVTVTTLSGCSWPVTSNAAWLTAGAGGIGPGTLNFSATANAGIARIGTLTIGDRTFTVTQAAASAAPQCAYTLDPPARSLTAAAQSTFVRVQTSSGCSWTAATEASWLTITSGASGTGNGTVAFSVAANTGPARSETIEIAGQTHTVNQASGCAVSINPSSATSPGSGGDGAPIAVTAGPTCSWTATTATSWITVSSGASGTGNGAVGYSVGANSGAARDGTISIATRTFTVSQAAGCTYSINPTSQSFGDKAKNGDPVSVTAPAGCAWTSTSNDSWITVKTGATGTGNGTMTFSVSGNGERTTRVGTLTIAGQTFTVTQAGR
jgi:hypothetical protein